MNRFVNENGSRYSSAQLIADYRKQRGISISNGGAALETMNGNGYTYGNGHIDSFCQIYGAHVITMTPGQKVAWETKTPDFEYSEIDPTAENGAVIIFEYAFGNGAAYPQPNGYFELAIDDEAEIPFSMKKESCLFENEKGIRLYLEVRRKKAVANPGEQFTLDDYIQNESIYVNGLAYLYIPQRELKGRKMLKLSVSAHNYDACSRRWLRIGVGYFLLCGNIYQGIEKVLHGKEQRKLEGQSIYFGDIHVHTAQTEYLNGDGCGIGSVKSNLTYARDVAQLDFCAITDHDWQLDASDWARVRSENHCFNQTGRFVTLNAFEWTSAKYGHRNVYFRNGEEIPDRLKPFDYQTEPYRPIKYGVSTENDPNPMKLWEWIEENHLEAITIPHHPDAEQFLMDFNFFFNEKYDRCVEIYSGWGCMLDTKHPLNVCGERIEGYGYQRYLNKLHMGFVASSDGHDGNAGDANISLDKRHLSHYAGSGHVAVLAKELSREAVYDAIRNRHCYAVTGEPILMQFSIDQAIMGDRLQVNEQPVSWSCHICGTFPLISVKLYKNGKEFVNIQTDGQQEIEYRDTLFISEAAVYYLEVKQADGEYAWSSPISVI